MSDPSDKPYHVRTNAGALHSGYDGESQAQAAASAANAEAERLGITTRYVVTERDES